MSELKKSVAVRIFLPVLLLFFVVNLFGVVFSKTLEKLQLDQTVLLIGNLVLFGVTAISFFLYQQAMLAGTTPSFVRNVYAGMLVKFFICILAAFIYIFNAKQNVNKAGIFVLMFLYLAYTFFEISILMKHSKKKSNA